MSGASSLRPGLHRPRIVGRFLPPTAAQVAALAAMGEVAVGVVAAPGDPVALHRRLAWLRESLPAATVEPVCIDSGWEAGTSLVGGEVAVLDEGAETVRLAGTSAVSRVLSPGGPLPFAVRADPMRHWSAIPVAARPHFVRRVRLFGPESVGKSVAAEALAARFGTTWAPEVSRAMYAAVGYRFAFEDVARVAAAQVEAEEAAARAATRVVVCDTDVLTTHLYALHYFGASPAVARRLADAAHYDATLLFNLDVPWEPDPCRDSPAVRAHLYGVFEAELRARGVAYTVVGGTGQARTEAAARAVEAVLAAPEPVRAP